MGKLSDDRMHHDTNWIYCMIERCRCLKKAPKTIKRREMAHDYLKIASRSKLDKLNVQTAVQQGIQRQDDPLVCANVNCEGNRSSARSFHDPNWFNIVETC